MSERGPKGALGGQRQGLALFANPRGAWLEGNLGATGKSSFSKVYDLFKISM